MPMDYEEFRWVLGDTTTVSLLQQAFTELKMPFNAVHQLLIKHGHHLP